VIHIALVFSNGYL